MMKTLPVLIVCLMLTGCGATKFDQSAAGPYPDNYKAIVKEYMLRSYYDPYSLRNVSISTPHSAAFAWQSGYWVCVECNGKNRMGGYVGLDRTGFFIANNVVTMNFNDWQLCYQQPFDDLTPWPEMEGK